MIYPTRTRSGVAQHDFWADRLEEVKIQGLTGYQTTCSVKLYYDGNYWTLASGAKFGAYVK